MSFANALQKAVQKVNAIPGIGTSITYRSKVAQTYNADKGTVKNTKTDTSLKGVFEKVNIREVTGLVQEGDRKCTISAADLSSTPTTADVVIEGGREYQITRVETTEQAGVKLSHILYLHG